MITGIHPLFTPQYREKPIPLPVFGSSKLKQKGYDFLDNFLTMETGAKTFYSDTSGLQASRDEAIAAQRRADKKLSLRQPRQQDAQIRRAALDAKLEATPALASDPKYKQQIKNLNTEQAFHQRKVGATRLFIPKLETIITNANSQYATDAKAYDSRRASTSRQTRMPKPIVDETFNGKRIATKRQPGSARIKQA